MAKIEKSEKVLAKLNSSWSPAELSADIELLTEEERESLRKIGMKLDKILLLGMYFMTKDWKAGFIYLNQLVFMHIV